MRTVKREQRESPTRFNTDLYIIRHSKKHKQLNNQNYTQNTANSTDQIQEPISKITVNPNSKTDQNQVQKKCLPQQDHRRNIDRLMGMLKQKSTGKIRKQKAVRNVFRWILKRLDNKIWLKGFTINKIKYINTYYNPFQKQTIQKKSYAVGWKTDKTSKTPVYVDIKGQQINLVDTKHIVSKENEQENVSLNNSLQNKLREISNSKDSGRTNSQKKLSKDIYILRRHEKGLIQSKKQLSTTNEMTSYKSLPKIDQISVRPSSPLSPSYSKALLALPLLSFQANIDGIPNFYQDKTPSFSVQPMKQTLQLNSPEHSSSQHSLIRQLNHAKHIQITKIQRKNRLMQNNELEISSPKKNQENSQKNNYLTRNENERQNILEQKQRNRCYTTGKITFTYSNRADVQNVSPNSFIPKKQQQNYPPTFFKTSLSNENNTGGQGLSFLPLGSKVSRSRVHISRRRCTSMPAVIFIYKNKQQMIKDNSGANNKEIIKGSPILQLNDMIKAVNRQNNTQDDPYLTNNVNNSNNNSSRNHRKFQYRETNNYNMPSIHHIHKDNQLKQILYHPHHHQNPILNNNTPPFTTNNPVRQPSITSATNNPAAKTVIKQTINQVQRPISNNAISTQNIKINHQINTIKQPLITEANPPEKQTIIRNNIPQKIETIRPSQYYGVNPQPQNRIIIPQQKPQNTINNRNRLKSLNTYILRKESPIKLTPGVIYLNERERARSLNPKIEVTLKKSPMINVY